MAVRRRYLEELAEQRFQGELRNSFLAALDRLASDMAFERVVELIEAGDVEAAVQAVGLVPESFPEMQAATAAAVAAGGNATRDVLPPKERARFVFEPGNPRAERAVDQLNTGLMRGLGGGPAITDEGQRAVRAHIRAGLEQGKNPRAVARQMRGTWDPKAKAYRGGMIGLTDSQAASVRRAEAQLRSGDPGELRKYLGRKLRDKRHDRTILRAINEGTAVPESTIEKAVANNYRKAVKFRSETVARDQALSALSQGQEEALDQMVEGGYVRDEDLVKEWVHAHDDRVRNAHRRIPGMNRGGIRRGEAFDTPLGPMRFPRDPQGTAANTINCFLPGTRVSGDVVAASKSWYSGQVVEIETRGGRNLAVTLNHPVMRSDGALVPAGELAEGDYLVNAGGEVEFPGRVGNDDEQAMPPAIEDVFSALRYTHHPLSTGVVGMDFHGDGRRISGDVEIVLNHPALMRTFNAALRQGIKDLGFKQADAITGTSKLLRPHGVLDFRGLASWLSSNGFVRGGDLTAGGFRVLLDSLPFQPLGFGSPASVESALLNVADDGGSGVTGLSGNRQNALAREVFADPIIDIRFRNFTGHVYDLQTVNTRIVAEGLLVSNCRCTTTVRVRRRRDSVDV